IQRRNHRRDGRCRAGVPSGADHAGTAGGRGPAAGGRRRSKTTGHS
ncbi:type IV secretion protein Rhs, partial [Escherichia coli]